MRWHIALAQHPMYLLIKEDTRCAERTPPWGEPTIERYIERVRQNLATLRRYPRLKIGFEWSAVELELLAEEGPDAFAELCRLAKEGRVAFYNGTYAQPHAQILSSESNYRQFEYGLRVYNELCGCEVKTYCHQETSIHDQMPQLLQAFGLRFANIPFFYSTLAWLDEGELEIRGFGGPYLHFVQGHEFVRWCGLDGTEIPLYLSQPGIFGDARTWMAREAMAGLMRIPPIILQIPDMIAVDDEWMRQREQADFVLLDAALAERLEQAPPRARARFYANWSYIEGVRAEELARHNWQAEHAVLQAEALDALAFALLDRPAQSTGAIWKTILTAQHHDVYCFGSLELRDKAIGWLTEAEGEARQLVETAAGAVAAQVNTGTVEGEALVVFSSVAHAHTALVTAEVTSDRPVIATSDGTPAPSDAAPLATGGARVRFLAQMDGLGYRTFGVKSGGGGAVEENVTEPVHVENPFYRTTLHPDGAFQSLVLIATGDELLNPTLGRGNQLAAMDSTAFAHKRDDSVTRTDWQPPTHGPELDLSWQTDGPARIRRSALGVAFAVSGRMSKRVEADLDIMLYNQTPRIDIAWTFRFDEASVGLFFEDETKLRVRWPLAFTGDVYHDIAFGAIRARSDRPLVTASWLDVCDGRKGLAYFHQGTPKHWVSDGIINNLFAWGEDTDVFGNRLAHPYWHKPFDQRLRGSHTIRCAVYPHAGDWQAADLVGAARSYGERPVVITGDKHGGSLPPDLNVLSFTGKNLAATSVRVDGAQVKARIYAASDQGAAADATTRGLQARELRSIKDEAIEHLGPFQIAELAFTCSDL